MDGLTAGKFSSNRMLVFVAGRQSIHFSRDYIEFKVHYMVFVQVVTVSA